MSIFFFGELSAVREMPDKAERKFWLVCSLSRT